MAIPMQVIRMEGVMAICRGRDGPEPVDTLLTGPLEAGQWVLCFLGAAREVVDAEHAARVGDALAALQAILSGEGDAPGLIDSHFADLVQREPQLPEHLRPAVTQGNPS